MGRRSIKQLSYSFDKLTGKEKYIALCFEYYNLNKRRLNTIELTFDGLKSVDTTRIAVTTSHDRDVGERMLVGKMDEKTTLAAQIQIVEKTIEHYEIEDKLKAEYIRLRFVKDFAHYQAAAKLGVADRTCFRWLDSILTTAQRIADYYNLWRSNEWQN